MNERRIKAWGLAVLLLLAAPSAHLNAQITKEEVLKQMRPSTGIEESPRTFWSELPRYGIWAGLGLVGLALVVIALSKVRRRPRDVASLPADRVALEELARLDALDLAGQGGYDRYCTALSNVVRRYVEQRFRLPATRQTTPEFLTGLRSANLFNDEQQESLRRFLEECDLAKFAGLAQAAQADQGAIQSHTLSAAARRFIEQTR